MACGLCFMLWPSAAQSRSTVPPSFGAKGWAARPHPPDIIHRTTLLLKHKPWVRGQTVGLQISTINSGALRFRYEGGVPRGVC